MNRKPVDKGDIPTKHQKIDKSNHQYSSNSAEIENNATHKRNYDFLKQEIAKPNPKTDIVMDLMRHTFGRRQL